MLFIIGVFLTLLKWSHFTPTNGQKTKVVYFPYCEIDFVSKCVIETKKMSF